MDSKQIGQQQDSDSGSASTSPRQPAGRPAATVRPTALAPSAHATTTPTATAGPAPESQELADMPDHSPKPANAPQPADPMQPLAADPSTWPAAWPAQPAADPDAEPLTPEARAHITSNTGAFPFPFAPVNIGRTLNHIETTCPDLTARWDGAVREIRIAPKDGTPAEKENRAAYIGVALYALRDAYKADLYDALRTAEAMQAEISARRQAAQAAQIIDRTAPSDLAALAGLMVARLQAAGWTQADFAAALTDLLQRPAADLATVRDRMRRQTQEGA